jgi:molybdopterin-biosynthesis enzyme MoeA-like protein
MVPFSTTLDRHDDITYQSIAKAFGLPLKLYNEAFEKMKKLSKPHSSQPNFSWDVDSPALKAKLRMVELPTDEAIEPEKQFLFPDQDLWVPVAVVNQNIHILPGVPKLCKCKPHASSICSLAGQSQTLGGSGLTLDM